MKQATKEIKRRIESETHALQNGFSAIEKAMNDYTSLLEKSYDKPLTFDEYQVIAKEIAFYPNLGNNLSYPALGLAEEAGEVCGKIKKLIRDDNGILTEKHREDIKKELGDVLFYVASQCWELGINMSEAAQSNIDKIQGRMKRGTLKGSGDNR